jgi:hypothetical protein
MHSARYTELKVQLEAARKGLSNASSMLDFSRSFLAASAKRFDGLHGLDAQADFIVADHEKCEAKVDEANAAYVVAHRLVREIEQSLVNLGGHLV